MKPEKDPVVIRLRSMLAPFVCLIMLLAVSCSSSTKSLAVETPTLTAGEALGKQVFAKHCASCHSTVPDSIIVGPSLAGVSTRAAGRIAGMPGRDYIELSIKQPGAYLVEGYPDLMPVTLSEILSEEEMDAILAYLMTLDE